MPKVLNRFRDKILIPSVYIGRPSMWGNPFIIGVDGTREEVIAKHKASLSPAMKKLIRKHLKGKNLVCYCAPNPCHGDTLLEIANSTEEE